MPAPDLLTSRASTPETPSNTDEMMDVPETAKRFGVHHQTVYRWLRTGTFPCHAVRIENTWRISRASVDAYLHGRALELGEVEPVPGQHPSADEANAGDDDEDAELAHWLAKGRLPGEVKP